MADAIGRSGPRTTKGKLRSRYNARKHGFFSKELHLSASERTEFMELRASLWEALKPNTALLALLFDDVMACAWRVKVALRCEQRSVEKQVASADDPQPLSDEPHMDSPPGTLELRARLRLVEDLRTAFKQNLTLSSQLKEQVSHAFDAGFLNTLVEWRPTNITLSLLMSSMLDKSKLLGTVVGDGPPSDEQKRHYMECDTELRLQMVLKLLDVKEQGLLFDLYRAKEAKAGGRLPEWMERLDLFVRYQTNARREFYRALGEYHAAKARSA